MKTMIHEEVFRGEQALVKMASQNIFVCGCGAIGSNLIDNLVRQGFQKITVLDMDRIEDHNRNTQIWGRREVGQYKTTAMKHRVYNEMGIQINEIHQELSEETIDKLIPRDALIIDGFDNTKSRQLLKDHCKKQSIECLHIGLSADYAEIVWNEEYSVPAQRGANVCEYPMARNIALMATTVASEILIRYILSGKKGDYTITLGDFKILSME